MIRALPVSDHLLMHERRMHDASVGLVDAFRTGLAANRSMVNPTASDFDFIERYHPRDENGNHLQFGDWKHQIDIYRDNHPQLVLMYGAQGAKTTRMFVHLARRMLVHNGSLFGYFTPDQSMAAKFSDDRFRPFLISMSEIAPLLGAAGGGRKGSDAVWKKSLGASMVYFMSTKAKTATEGSPLRGVYFDELRRMDFGDIERGQERYSAQREPIDVKASTASIVGSTIHTYFMRSNQNYFHTETDHPDGLVLSLEFPNCIMDLRNASPSLLRKVEHAFARVGKPMCGMTDAERERYPLACYHDPRTGFIITDPREGWWEPHNPKAYVHGYQVPQMLSPMWSAGRFLQKYEDAHDKGEFRNSGLGLSDDDESQREVSEHEVAACVNSGAEWPARRSHDWRRRNMRNCAMGVDVQKGYLVAVVKQRTPNGKHGTVHVEIVYEGTPGNVGKNPWKRLAELMVEYDISIAVIDAAPDYSGSQSFAMAFYGKVWLASYAGAVDIDTTIPLVAWSDVTTAKPGREARTDLTVRIHRTKGLRWSLAKWKTRANEMPDPERLWQPLPCSTQGEIVLTANLGSGTWQSAPVAKLYMKHMRCIVFRDEIEDMESQEKKAAALARGKSRLVALHVDLDPHFAHADLYANFALDRIVRGPNALNEQDS